MNFKNIKTIFKKEILNLFDRPFAYIIIVVFLLLWEFLFFRNYFLVGQASLTLLFDLLPWLFLFLIPALTMNTLSEEKSEGTLEFLLTHPLTDLELLLAKFLSSFSFVTLLILLTLPIPLSLSSYGNFDWGIIFSEYLGAILMAGVLTSLGIFISSLFASSIASLLVSMVTSFFLTISGFELVTAILPLSLSSTFEQLSVYTHFTSISRGVIDVADLWYFLSMTFIFLSLTYLQFLKRKFGRHQKNFQSYRMTVFLLIGILILVNILGNRIPGRLDLTENRAYSLSPATKNTLKELKDVVNITVYASSELPSSFQPVLREVKDILRDYKNFSKSNVTVSYKDPQKDSTLVSEALSLGIQEVQFNTIGEEEYQVKNGYLGLAVSYAGESEVIPFIEATSDLEYQLTSFIKKLTVSDKKKIAFLQGHGEKSLYSAYTSLQSELENQFTVTELTLDEETKTIDASYASLVIAGPNTAFTPADLEAVKNYLSAGGSLFLMIDGIVPDLTILSANPNPNNFTDFTSSYGFEISQNLVHDLKSNETVSLGASGGYSYLISYPYFVKALVKDVNPINSQIETISLPWPSSVSVNEEVLSENSLTLTTLYATSSFAGKTTENFSLDPQQEFASENLATFPIAILIANEDSSEKIVAISDSDFLTDDYLSGHTQNLSFAIQALSYLAEEDSLASIKIKQVQDRSLLFKDNEEISFIKYGNLVFVALIPISFGIIRLVRRKNLSKLTYSSYKKYVRYK